MSEDNSLDWYDGLAFNLTDEVTYEVIYYDGDEVYQFELYMYVLEEYHEGNLKLIL